MKIKKNGLLVIAGLLVIGIICGAGAAAYTDSNSNSIHIFDKSDYSKAAPYGDPAYDAIEYLGDVAKDIVTTGYQCASTISLGVLEPVTDMIDEQIKYAFNYVCPSDYFIIINSDETADDNYAKVSYFNLTDETLANKEAGQFTTYENGAAAPGLANETQKYNSSVTILKNESSVAEPEEITLDVSDESARITKTYTKNTNHEKIETEQVENQMTETENAVNAETKDSFGISSIHFNVDDSTELKTTDLDSSARRTVTKK